MNHHQDTSKTENCKHLIFVWCGQNQVQIDLHFHIFGPIATKTDYLCLIKNIQPFSLYAYEPLSYVMFGEMG